MIKYLIQGFILGLSYVAPIGMQNLYVINSSISMNKKRAYEVAFITIFFDISLSLSSFFGIGLLINKFNFLKLTILLLGSIIVSYIGICLIKSKPSLSTQASTDTNIPISKVALACFTVTWLNPQAILDGTLLLGGFRASLPLNTYNFFIGGVCTASLVWFTSLAAFFSIFKNIFNEKILKKINILCGCVVMFYGIKLLYSFLKAI
ncbi:LysE/ArgO family amino acid transporter [Clostridium sp. JS66]|uniref:LysE/ArgO family amino acid transporter n=1 Tax=Clostridium sp. JS66 TaxID=3064705 RepID=UPI00298E1FBD|nr:LysE family transporter [Clostridium sp. JS66]WPC41622.1 LysE family transporter [Clostridium sp. JS66]